MRKVCVFLGMNSLIHWIKVINLEEWTFPGLISAQFEFSRPESSSCFYMSCVTAPSCVHVFQQFSSESDNIFTSGGGKNKKQKTLSELLAASGVIRERVERVFYCILSVCSEEQLTVLHSGPMGNEEEVGQRWQISDSIKEF